MPDGSLVELEDKTDWARVKAMTEEEIEANALSDPDSGWESDEELEQDRRVPFAKLIRVSSGLTQEAFAARYEIPLGTLRDWEQGISEPDSAARALLKVISHRPEAVVEALALHSRKANAA
jgi:putative transcriptional regulator